MGQKNTDLSDEVALAEREKEAKIRAISREKMLREWMSGVEGRAFFRDLISTCHVFGQPPIGNHAETDFWLGERSIGLRIWADLEAAAPESMIQMLRERANG